MCYKVSFSQLIIYYFMVAVHSQEKSELFKDYCVIGAGPSGLQMGYFLEKSKRDYVVFERNDGAGSFFKKYPRHRKLISINKRFTGKANKEFNLRHDWNSLISDDQSLLFTKYTKDYFPHADTMVTYLNDFQQKFNINVNFNTEITNVTYHTNYVFQYSMNDQHGNNYFCKRLLIGTGLSVPVIPSVVGQELIEGYEDISIDPADYEGQSILILGKGNSAFELAASIYGHAAVVHVVGRDRIRLSWDTHYVGDLRGINNELLDSYMLKSLDGIIERSVSQLQFTRGTNGKIHITTQPGQDGLPSSSPPPSNRDNYSSREGYDRVIRCLGFTWDVNMYHNSTRPRGSGMCSKYDKSAGKYIGYKVHNKFPDISYDYQSTQFNDMYFLGPLVHSLDFRKSAGGFIHGFRYLTRVLHRLLEWKHHRVSWPSQSRKIIKLMPTLLNRANEGSGIYQMFQYLGDIAIIRRHQRTFKYLEEFPISLIADLQNRTGHDFNPITDYLLVMVMEYGKNWSRPGQDHFTEDRSVDYAETAHQCKFLHPVVYIYKGLPSSRMMEDRTKDETLPKPFGIHHIVEDFTTIFNGPGSHLEPLRAFLEHHLNQDFKYYHETDCLLQKMIKLTNDLPENCPNNAQESVFV